MTVGSIELEAMTPEHLDGALALSRQAGWPHRRADWELAQALSQGVVAVEDGRVVATTLMTPYGDDAGTINMVVVDEAARGRGLGRMLMEAALARAGARTCYLVATPEGLPLYEKLGFIATGTIAQHQGEAAPVGAPDGVSWAEAHDHPRLAILDRAAFGHDRSALMQALRATARFAVLREGSAVEAFAAIRPFGRDLVIGPVVARSAAEAKLLVGFLLAHHRGRFVRLDTDSATGLADWLVERGLARVGGGIAMRRSGEPPRARAGRHRTYALVNQALG